MTQQRIANTWMLDIPCWILGVYLLSFIFYLLSFYRLPSSTVHLFLHPFFSKDKVLFGKAMPIIEQRVNPTIMIQPGTGTGFPLA
jgi:hypothetical protein